MPAVLGLVHPVANPFIKDQAFPSSCSADHTVGTFRQAWPSWSQNGCSSSKPHMLTCHCWKVRWDHFPFWFFNFQKPSFPEASQQTSFHVSLVRIVSPLSHSISRIWEWPGRAFLAWYLVTRHHLKAGLGLEFLFPRWLAHMAGQLVLASPRMNDPRDQGKLEYILWLSLRPHTITFAVFFRPQREPDSV